MSTDAVCLASLTVCEWKLVTTRYPRSYQCGVCIDLEKCTYLLLLSSPKPGIHARCFRCLMFQLFDGSMIVDEGAGKSEVETWLSLC